MTQWSMYYNLSLNDDFVILLYVFCIFHCWLIIESASPYSWNQTDHHLVVDSFTLVEKQIEIVYKGRELKYLFIA